MYLNFLLLLITVTSLVPISAFAGKTVELDTGVQVTDYLGRSVHLPAPAKRIVALAPHIVENLYSAGVGDKIVGAVEYSDYPAAALKIPRVGAVSTFSLETIVALKPDLVIVWMSTRGGDILQQLDQLGLNTYASDPHHLSDVAKSIRDFGTLGGNQIEAQKRASEFETKLVSIREQYSGLIPVTTFYEVWFEPLQTLNGEHIITDVLRICGGENIFSNEPLLAPKVSLEAVISRNPSAIIASGENHLFSGWVKQWQQWPMINAVKHNNMYLVPGDYISRHTVRILKGATMICEYLQQARV